MRQLKAERLVLKHLNAGCHEPVGIYCQEEVDGLSITGIYGTGQILNRAAVREAELTELQGLKGTGTDQALELLAFRLAKKLLKGIESSGGMKA